ncbi:MAG: GNAT family N-acetyltransferase [Thermoleophilaceae bacterium]|nr:GNAT family N-acetyltransferase [Thermoleophilaceae bacterium]
MVLLRPPEERDVPALVAMHADERIARFTGVPWPYREIDARAWLAAAPGRRSSGEGADFVIVDRADTELLGTIGLVRVRWEDMAAEAGYSLAAGARGKGYATRAVMLVTDWCFHSLGIRRMEITTHLDNDASQAVAERAGYQREGVLRGYRVLRDRRWDLLMFSRLPGDPPPPGIRGSE